MKWIELLRKDGYALLQSESDTQYAVVSGYDPAQSEDQQWNYGTYFCYWNQIGNDIKAQSLARALELFRSKTESDYITKQRLEELAIKFKDSLLERDIEDAEWDIIKKNFLL